MPAMTQKQQNQRDLDVQSRVNWDLNRLESIVAELLASVPLDSEGRFSLRVLDSIPHANGLVMHFCHRMDSERTSQGMGVTPVYVALIRNSTNCKLYKYVQYAATHVTYTDNANMCFPKVYSEFEFVDRLSGKRGNPALVYDPAFVIDGIFMRHIEEMSLVDIMADLQ
ncbi:hypothetical protein [Carp edema virus]|nr:hypothetical protein [Carp edema virus]